MNHIIILTSGYFPENLKLAEGDTITLLAPADGVIPVSVYADENFRNMNVEVIPQTDSEQETYLYCAYRIGQLSAKMDNVTIHTSFDQLKAVIEGKNSGKAAKTTKRARKTVAPKEPVKSGKVSDKTDEVKIAKKTPVKQTAEKPEFINEPAHTQRENNESTKTNKPAKPEKNEKNDKTKKAGSKITEQQVKAVLDAKMGQYAKNVVESFNRSNSVTFEMNVRMALAAAGAEPDDCKTAAKLMMDEFGSMLPMT